MEKDDKRYDFLVVFARKEEEEEEEHREDTFNNNAQREGRPIWDAFLSLSFSLFEVERL